MNLHLFQHLNSILKSMIYAGPIPAASSIAGITILSTSLFADSTRMDILLAIGVFLLILSFVEWALARRFSTHEEAEKKQSEAVLKAQHDTYRTILTASLEPLRNEMNRLVMVFDGNQAAFDQYSREFKSLKASIDNIQASLDSLHSQKLEERVARIEKILRDKAL
jgi:uncharacterized membrane protein YvbJ